MYQTEDIIHYILAGTSIMITLGFWGYFWYLKKDKDFVNEVLKDGIWADSPEPPGKEVKEKILRGMIAARERQVSLAAKYGVIFSVISFICIFLLRRS